MEIMGTAALYERATAQGVLLPARLRLEQRSDVRNGQTRKYPVPVIDLDVSAREIAAIDAGEAPKQIARAAEQRALPAAPTVGTGDAEAGEREGGAAVDGTAAPPEDSIVSEEPIDVPGEEEAPTLSPADSSPASSSEPERPSPMRPESDSEAGVELLTQPQERLVKARARSTGLGDEARRAIIEKITGQPHVSGIPKAKVDEVLREFEEWSA